MSKSDLYIYGRHTVEEALEEQPENIDKIFLRDTLKSDSVRNVTDQASRNRIPVSHVPGPKLYDLVGNVNDQGIVALMSAVSYIDYGEWIDEKLDKSSNPAILLLDEIEDPRNVGAIVRTAAAAGIEAVLVPKHRQAPINAAVYKTSAGTADRIPIVRIGNMNQTIMDLKEEGFWIGGLDQNGEDPLWEQEFEVPMAFVIGNEEQGISQKTLEHCDFNISIPMLNRVPSLNASVSAAILCYEWLRQREEA